MFNSQEALGNICPLTAIEKFSDVRNGMIRADFYDDCQDIPDSSALDPAQKNLLLLDEAYYTRGRHNNCDTIYIAQCYFRLPRHTFRENSIFIILFPQGVKNLTHIHADHCASDISLLEFEQFCHRVWSENHNFITIDLASTPMNGKYRQNFNRFYFPTGTISSHCYIHILSVIMEEYWSIIVDAFRDRFTTTELLSYKEVLYEEATEERYAQRDPAEVDREERNCIRLAQQFTLWKSTENGFHLCTLSITNTERSSTSRKLPLTRPLYIPVG